MDRAQRPLRTAAVAAAALGLALAGCGESRNVGKTTSTPASGTTQQGPSGGAGAPGSNQSSGKGPSTGSGQSGGAPSGGAPSGGSPSGGSPSGGSSNYP